MATLNIPISKGGKDCTFALDTDVFNQLMTDNPELAQEIVAEGFKTILNKRMTTGFDAPSKLKGEALEKQREAALAKAQQNLDDFVAGNLSSRKASTKAKGIDRAVMTEAMNAAKAVVRDLIRKAGKRPSLVAAKDITAAAKRLVEDDPSYIEAAKATIAERAQIKASVDLGDLLKEDATLVAKADKAKAERKAQLSAKQAGKPEKRAKGGKVPPRRPEMSAGSAAH